MTIAVFPSSVKASRVSTGLFSRRSFSFFSLLQKATFLDVGERKRRHRQRSNLVNLNVEIPGIETAGTEASTETHHARNGSGKRRDSGTSSCCGDSQGVVAQVGSGGLNGSGQNEEGNDDDLSQECQVDHDDDLSQESALDDEDDIECAGSETVGGREDDDDDKQAILIDSHIETETNESPLSTATEERSAVPEKSAQEQPVTVQEVDSTAGNEAPSLLPCASTSHSEEDKGDNKSDVADEKAVSELENSEPGSISLYSQLDERGMLNEQPSLKRSDTEESGERVVPASVFRGLDVRDQRKEDDDVEEINGNARKGVENDEAQHDEKNQRHPGQLQMHELRSSKRSTNFIIPEYETAEETKEEIDNEEDNQHDEDTNHEIDFKQLPIPFIRTESFQTVASEYTYGDDDSCTTATGDNVCNICLCGYKMGDMLIASKYCTHVFHKDCILQWLQKHDECPMCRVNMVTDVDMSRAASSLVGKTRMYRAVASMRHPVGGNGLHQGYRQAYAQRYHVNLSQHQGGAARPSPLQGTVRRGASHL